ncbi:hypothetical protein D3C83_14950 [compost metagenome]
MDELLDVEVALDADGSEFDGREIARALRSRLQHLGIDIAGFVSDQRQVERELDLGIGLEILPDFREHAVIADIPNRALMDLRHDDLAFYRLVRKRNLHLDPGTSANFLPRDLGTQRRDGEDFAQADRLDLALDVHVHRVTGGHEIRTTFIGVLADENLAAQAEGFDA